MTLQEFFAKDDSWCQKAYKDSTGQKRCLMGALLRCYLGEQYQSALRCLIKAVNAQTCNDVISWNDAPGRTIDDVRELVRKAGV